MRRRALWRRRYRRLPLSARVSLAATAVPAVLALAFLCGLARVRPLRASLLGVAALAFGFVASGVLLSSNAVESASPARSYAAEPNPGPIEPAPIVVAAPKPLRLPTEPGASAAPVDQVVRVGKGDTLIKLLVDAGIDRGEAHEAIAALKDVYDPRRLRIGQSVTLIYDAETGGAPGPSLVGMRLAKSFDRDAGAGRLADGRFEAFEIEKQLDLRLARAGNTIRSSLFEDGAAEGVPARIMVEMFRLFSYDVDFQRDIHAGDAFDILFERYHDTEAGSIAREGEILYASLTLGGKTFRLYRFERGDDNVEYFNEKGESIRKELLRTPIDGARLSSRFGMRRHPILGYSKMHQGIDFAAPTGTPIMAAGNGTIDFIGRKGGYGKYVRIRHNGEYSTAYAHMSRFASDAARGRRVKQGDVIGYVGTTGRSTGPHLHYEVLRGGAHINPESLKLPSGTKLAGKDQQRFRALRARIDNMLNGLPPSTLVARAGH